MRINGFLKRGIILGVGLMFFISVQAQNMSIAFTTTKITGAKYTPEHILAIWIKDSNDKYVRTLMVYAATRKSYLIKWNASSGGDKTDATTGATLSTQKSYDLSWNMKNYLGTVVSNGTYKLCMEMTSSDGQGPYREISFTLDGKDFTLNSADGNYFTGVSFIYENGVAAVETSKFVENFVKPYLRW
jgi:hypothetical protein